jgi:FKBP-type peptidyl-prolyl cis-trans isomerase
MKKTIIILCLMFSALAAYARAIQEDINLAEERARMSYAFGMVIGSDLQPSGLDFNYSAFAEGVRASMKKETKITHDEAVEIVRAAFETAMTARAEENRNSELKFLAENGEKPGVTTTPSGLQYEVLKEGSGESPASIDTVRVNYEGSLTDGSVFDGNEGQGAPAEFPLDRVIPGWTEGIQLMNVGSVYRFYIPSRLAYGEQGAAPVIPPNSTLIFTVELLEVIKVPEDSEEWEE